jgi:peptidoglycan/LPS O-acetylase OafA/YrhL
MSSPTPMPNDSLAMPQKLWRSGTLGNFAGSRDNNFNLVRVIAAMLVLYSHSFALATGRKETEPLAAALGTTPGGIAVDIFFITSGFLVTASLLSRSCARDFIRARVLRIYPALTVATFLTVCTVGAVLTELSTVRYLLHPETLLHLARNITLVTGISHTLPGVFVGNPYPNAVNSSLWSLPYEIGMYTGLLTLWLSVGIEQRRQRLIIALIAIAAVALAAHFFAHGFWRPSSLLRLTWMFAAGALIQLYRDRIIVTPARLAIALACILLASAERTVFLGVYTLLMPFVTLALAYVPGGAVRHYNRLGDYSYGIYIYAFPIQQTLALVIPSISIVEMIVWSGLLTTATAVFSWHLVEKRALALRDRLPRPSKLRAVNVSAD